LNPEAEDEHSYELGFEKGSLYNRRLDIHGRFCCQQHGGIISPANIPSSYASRVKPVLAMDMPTEKAWTPKRRL
jgi:hypothetical protein